MARDYTKLARGQGIWLPRWVVIAVPAIIVLWAALRILVPPSWIVQQLDSPDGARSARLLRTRYVKDSFVIRVRDGKLWNTAFYSGPITNDLRVDLGERLSWTGGSSRLLFRLQGAPVWGYDFDARRALQRDEIDVYGASSPAD